MDRLSRGRELARCDAEKHLVAVSVPQVSHDRCGEDEGEDGEQQCPEVDVVHPANLRLDRVSDLTTTVVVRVEHVSDSRVGEVPGAFRDRDGGDVSRPTFADGSSPPRS